MNNTFFYCHTIDSGLNNVFHTWLYSLSNLLPSLSSYGSTHLGTSHASHGTQSTFMSEGHDPRGFQCQEDSKVAGLAWCVLVGSVFIFKLCETQHH